MRRTTELLAIITLLTASACASHDPPISTPRAAGHRAVLIVVTGVGSYGEHRPTGYWLHRDGAAVHAGKVDRIPGAGENVVRTRDLPLSHARPGSSCDACNRGVGT